MQNVMQIATNAGHTAQNDGRTAKMTDGPRKMTAATHLMFAKDQRGGLRSPPGPQGTPLPLYMKKTLVSRNDFRTLGKKNRK